MFALVTVAWTQESPTDCSESVQLRFGSEIGMSVVAVSEAGVEFAFAEVEVWMSCFVKDPSNKSDQNVMKSMQHVLTAEGTRGG